MGLHKGYIPLIMLRLFAFKIFLGLGVGVTYLIRILFAFKIGVYTAVSWGVRANEIICLSCVFLLVDNKKLLQLIYKYPIVIV